MICPRKVKDKSFSYFCCEAQNPSFITKLLTRHFLKYFSFSLHTARIFPDYFRLGQASADGMDSYAARGKGLKNKYSSVVSSIATNVSTRPKVTVKKHSAKIQITSRTPQMFVRQTKSYVTVPSIYIDEVIQSQENISSSLKPSSSHSSETKK